MHDHWTGGTLEALKSVEAILRYRNRHDLAGLLSRALMEFEVFDEGYDMSTGSPIPLAKAVIHAPIADYDRLRALADQDTQQILDAVNEIWPYKEGDSAITGIIYRLDPESLQEAPDNSVDLLNQLDHLRNVMIAVSTGGPRIDEVNAEYKEALVNLTRELGKWSIQNPIPYRDLWDWYGKWSSGDLPTYQSRREYIRGLIGPLEARLRNGLSSAGTVVFQEPTGWPRVDRTLGEVRSRLESASTEEQFQAVGLLCREALISLAQTVFDPDRHPALDGVEVSKTDAKRMLDRYLAEEVGGKPNTISRRHAKASLELAVALQHKRTAGFRDAALCAEATASVVNIIAILSGIRDP